MKKNIFALSIAALSLAGCKMIPDAPAAKFDRPIASQENELAELSVRASSCLVHYTYVPYSHYEWKPLCKTVELTVANKTDEVIYVDWNISRSITFGRQDMTGFMFEGVKYIDRNNPKSDLMIMPNMTQVISLTPTNNVSWESGSYAHWSVSELSKSFGGVFLIKSENKKAPVQIQTTWSGEVIDKN